VGVASAEGGGEQPQKSAPPPWWEDDARVTSIVAAKHKLESVRRLSLAILQTVGV
jgi:hypothetical protein